MACLIDCCSLETAQIPIAIAIAVAITLAETSTYMYYAVPPPPPKLFLGAPKLTDVTRTVVGNRYRVVVGRGGDGASRHQLADQAAEIVCAGTYTRAATAGAGYVLSALSQRSGDAGLSASPATVTAGLAKLADAMRHALTLSTYF